MAILGFYWIIFWLQELKSFNSLHAGFLSSAAYFIFKIYFLKNIQKDISVVPCLFVCLFDLIPSTIFQFNRDGSSWVEPVLS